MRDKTFTSCLRFPARRESMATITGVFTILSFAFRGRKEDITKRYRCRAAGHRSSLRNIACKNIQRRASRWDPWIQSTEWLNISLRREISPGVLTSAKTREKGREREGGRERERERDKERTSKRSNREKEKRRGTRRGMGNIGWDSQKGSGYSSAKLFLFSFPLFLSRKPTASPYKLPFVPLISPWPLVRTYLIRINARAAWKLASCPSSTPLSPTIATSCPCLAFLPGSYVITGNNLASQGAKTRVVRVRVPRPSRPTRSGQGSLKLGILIWPDRGPVNAPFASRLHLLSFSLLSRVSYEWLIGAIVDGKFNGDLFGIILVDGKFIGRKVGITVSNRVELIGTNYLFTFKRLLT